MLEELRGESRILRAQDVRPRDRRCGGTAKERPAGRHPRPMVAFSEGCGRRDLAGHDGPPYDR